MSNSLPQDWHESHIPTEPMTIGYSKDLVYCKACGALLRSEDGPATNRRMWSECVPTPITFRGEQ